MGLAYGQNHDVGKLLTTAPSVPPTSALAAGTGDATEVSGASIDRLAFGSLYLSGKVVISGQATLAEGKTLAVVANVQDSPNDSDWTDYGDALASVVVATGPSGGGAVGFTQELDVDLQGAAQYVRIQATPDLNATGTDTAIFSALLVMGGADQAPAS